MSKIPPQTDVRIRGGQTTVKVLHSGQLTIERFKVLLEELNTPAVSDKLRNVAVECQASLLKLTTELPF